MSEKYVSVADLIEFCDSMSAVNDDSIVKSAYRYVRNYAIENAVEIQTEEDKMKNFKYKIMRLHITPNELMIDLYNEIFKTNIELKLCRSGRISRFKALTVVALGMIFPPCKIGKIVYVIDVIKGSLV